MFNMGYAYRNALDDKPLAEVLARMKLVFAPDSFKGSVSAVRITEILEARAKARFGDVECVCLPVADGGEGTAEALVRVFGGELAYEYVRAPMGDMVKASYARLPGGRAVIEMARASGLTLVPPDKRDIMRASSYGFGELIRAAMDADARELIIGIGGSATNDGGMGMLTALGARFYAPGGRALSGAGAQLSEVDTIDLSGLDKRLKAANIRVLSDVTNPLLGDAGAARVYAPQKGAHARAVELLESGMAHYARAFMEQCGLDIASFPGAGAAGGCGAALRGVIGAETVSGIDAVLDMVSFDAHIKGAALAVTGEGRVDAQTARFGKVPAGVIKRCARAGVPCAVITGGVGAGAEALYDLGDCMLIPIVNAPMTLEAAMQNGEELISQTADRIFWAFRAGKRAARD